ncbi:3'-5' exoribonuclease [Halomarina oriensis]|uniref:3'-5' exoribonuclease n=2 Tax=Halomarina oriensis TaxID=671145 RepID=A0A6B0GLM1_9EURY|nr:3'-5' exoribonuclease [Halomarina oriensis]
MMLDLETLGLDPGCVILSLGAVAFDEEGVKETFSRSISLKSCDEAGLEIDAGTLEWWLGQDENVQEQLTGGDELTEVLHEFSEFYSGAEEIWGNSPSFDCEILSAAYDAANAPVPWEFYHERCFRTLKAMPGAVDLEREGDHHDALDDAVHQARRASATLARWSE